MEEQEPVDEENLDTEEGREAGVASGSLEPREAAFMEGYESQSKDDEDDYGLDDDEKIED